MRFFTLILIVFLYSHSMAQLRIISGKLTSSEDGSAMPGINITIKGTATGTVTDEQGAYSIQVPIGATLVFSFIGMQSKEVVVTADNFQAPKNVKSKENKITKAKTISSLPRSLYKDTVGQTQGVAVLTDDTPTYKSKTEVNPETIQNIKRAGNSYVVISDNDPIKRSGFGLQISSAFGVEQINALPSLQNNFAQGRPIAGQLKWRGADEGEVFSWGPLLRTLEYDGSNYAFDKNGKLVTAGSGTGKAANLYNASDFFKTGFTTVNEVTLTLPGPKKSTLIFDLENRKRKGVIPGSEYDKINFSSSVKDFNVFKNLKANASLTFNKSTGKLLNRGANMASILGSVYRTPISFDNLNGLRTVSTEAYQLENGNSRSHAPGLVDNPYGLSEQLPDRENLERLIPSLQLVYNPDYPFSIALNGNIDFQQNAITSGIPTGYSAYIPGRLTDRNDKQILTNIQVMPSYRFNWGNGNLKLNLTYQTQYAQRNLNRTDRFHLNDINSSSTSTTDSIIRLNRALYRNTHEIVWNAQYEIYNWLKASITNRSYFSNTAKASSYTNVFPAASASVDIAEYYGWTPLQSLKVFGAASRSLQETPLIYSNWSYGSMNLPIEKYNTFYEATELFFNSSLSPEIINKLETGVHLQNYYYSNFFSFDATYFNHQTSDFIVPVQTTTGFELQNAATIQNYGATISAGYTLTRGAFRWNTELNWSKYKSKVQQLYNQSEYLPLAGFESIQTVLAKGQPVGAIYGTTYLKNDEGKLIIGNDGFPIEDSKLKMIGSPVPDWTMGWTSSFQWKALQFSFVFDFKKGGQVWNGTNALLDYLGRSATTGKLRSTSNYVFDGVNTNGSINTIPVSFADPSHSLNENRWVRYGWDGVGEDHIENASWIRLNEVSLSYTIKANHNRIMKEVKFSLVGHNLFLITPYSGVDPSSLLFNYGTGNGLDLFNTPSTRSYNAQVTIKI